jgi:hypothetical protein
MHIFIKESVANIANLIAIMLLGSLSISISAFADESYHEQIKHYVFVTSTEVSSPIGYWLLVRKDKTTCAIRFTDHQTTGGTSYVNYSGSNTSSDSEGSIHAEYHGFAEYDFFSQIDGSGNFKNNNVTLGHNKITSEAGARRGDQSKDDVIGCGSLTLHWVGAGIGFNHDGKQDEGIELAPTKWRDASEINIKDPRIKWYRFDKTSKYTRIPIENLW